jgi:hypothetical protein
MKTNTSALAKGVITAVAAGAMAVSSATPAVARDGRDHDGISVGDVIAGAVIIGGIAAIASASSNNSRDRDYRYDRAGYGDYGRYDNGRYEDRGYGGNPRRAVEQCIAYAERDAGRYSYGRADVTDIRSVKNTRYGFEVKGRIAVNSQGRDWRRGDREYGNGWGNDHRGWNNNLRGYDSGSFKCKFERGRVVDIDYSGVRGL